MIAMLEPKRSRRAILCGIGALAATGTEDMRAINVGERAAGVDGLALAKVPYPRAAEIDVIIQVRVAGFTRVYSTGWAHWPTVPVVTGRRPSPATATGWIRSGDPILKSPGNLS